MAAVVAISTGGAGGALAATALARGDANTASCPATSESSPGFRASLPDCRAYELVSEANSSDSAIIIPQRGFPEGEHFTYHTGLPTPGAGAGNGMEEYFLATRTAGGWRQQALSLPQGEGPRQVSLGALSSAAGLTFANHFADALLMSPFQDPFEAPRIDESTGILVYDLSLSSGAVSTVSLPDSGKLTQSMLEFPSIYGEDGRAFSNGWGAFLVGASEDGSRVFFITSAKLTTAPGTPEDTHQASSEIYERTGGHTYLVGILPDGEVPVCGAETGQGDHGTSGEITVHYGYGAIAPDGSTVVFTTPGHNALATACTESETGLFLRNVVEGTTVRLPGQFYAGRTAAGPGAEEVILTVGASRIFEYHVATRQTVEVASNASGLLAYSTDGSRVYYLGPEEGIYLYEEGAAAPKLVPGSLHSRYTGAGVKEEIGRPNVRFTGGLIETETETASGQVIANAPVTTSDGKFFMFVNPTPLTSYQTCVEIEGNEQCHYQVYLYDAVTNAVTCVSCNPMSGPLNGDAGFIEGKFHAELESPFVPPAPPLLDSRPAEDGREAVMRAAFETTEGLVPQDTNGTTDVYEWEQEETEGCSRGSLGLASLTESSAYSEMDHGCLYLLSSGAGREVRNVFGTTDGTHLVGASEDLKDVYMQTPEQLLPGLDEGEHIYDARIAGGFPYAAPSKGCEPGRCRSEAESSPAFGEPPSVGFAGAGNLKPATGKPNPPRLSRKRKLARALAACRRRKDRRSRAACERRARRRYGGRASHATRRRHRGGSK